MLRWSSNAAQTSFGNEAKNGISSRGFSLNKAVSIASVFFLKTSGCLGHSQITESESPKS
jgi:hypothetical protein